MVDSTKSIGQVPGIAQADRPQPKARSKDTDETEKKRRHEEVEAKKKTLNASEAQQTAQDTRKKLENSAHTLSSGQGFDETV